jgi:hypothetical protein
MSRQIVIDILGDASKFTKATKDAQTTAQKFSTSIKQGLGIGAGIGAFNLLSLAIGKTTDFLGDTVKAGIEEQASIQKLTTSLRTNVPAWNGRTDAIEKTIKAQMALGFSDEEQRDSMARLVAVTHSVTRAQTIMRTAMDLARFKGISLAEATQALINIEGGRYKALGALIGSTKEIKSETEALAAVQKAAGNAAADYAQTTGGKLLTAQTLLNDKMDTLGGYTVPLLDHALGGLLTTLGEIEGESVKAKGIARMGRDAWDAIPSFTNLDNAIRDVAGSIPAATDATGDLGAEVDDTKRSVISLTDAWLDNAKAMIDHKYNAKELGLEIKITKGEVKKAQAELRKITDGEGRPLHGHTWQEVNELKLEILRGQRRTEELTADLRGVNQVSLSKVGSVVAGLTAKLWGAAGAASTLNHRLGVTNALGAGAKGAVQGRAGGGSASGLTWVGEQGPELVNLPSGSYVNTASQSKAMASGGSGISVVVNGNIYGPSGVDELMDMMAKRLRLDGV